MSEALSQQERLRAIAEKRKKEAEIENKRRQLEDDRRQLQHLKSKALRERWLLDGAPSSGEDEAQKQLQEDEAKTKLLEKTILGLEQEIDELENGVPLNKASEDGKENAPDGPVKVENGIQQPSPNADQTTKKQITGIEAKLQCTNPDVAIENASADHPVTMVFMGYKNVEDEAETKKALGIEETVKAEFVVIEDSESKGEQAPLNGSTSTPDKAQDKAKNEESKEEGNSKEKQSCKCCTVM
ncbi:paralemmin-1-like isoform X1 [Myxocyprinus asiaticus]|uniref:paralemmin-1-like isoform X1 n=1 Tax=Myxocyprinus asiaticus TaxID=70543 RepID=UPI002222C394|nr:paralemmin-1-like isoform X1 [Myxocyprinus asiaticus]